MTHNTTPLTCRAGCGACCIAPSISSAIPDMPLGKPAGVPCVQLDDALQCKLFGSELRPRVCGSLKPSVAMCGTCPDIEQTREHALRYLEELEHLTQVHL